MASAYATVMPVGERQVEGSALTTQTGQADQGYRQYAVEEYAASAEPFYLPVGDEIELFEAAFHQKIPVLLKGPTGAVRRALSNTWRTGYVAR